MTRVRAGDPGPEGVVAPSREDAVVRAASPVIGGPAGSRLASADRPWAAVPVLVVLGMATLAAAVAEKQHCRAQGWTSPDQFWHACYSDIPVLFGSAGLGGAARPGLTAATGPDGIGQPPLASALMWLASAFVPGGRPDAALVFFDLSTLLLAALLACAVTAVALAAGRRRWDAAHVAVSPLIVLSALISYQLLAVALLSLALLAWERGRFAVGGIVLGLACAAAPQLGMVAVAAVLAGVAADRSGDGLRFGGSALVAWFAVRVVLLPGNTGGLQEAWDAWRTSAPGYGSLWLLPQLVDGAQPRGRRWAGLLGPVDPLSATTASALALTCLAALVVGVGIRVAGLPSLGPGPGVPVVTLARISLVLVAGVLVIGTSLPVQASLLLLPLVALAGLSWRDHLIWATTEAAYFVGVWLYIAGQSEGDRGLPGGVYLVMLVARLAGIGWLALRAGVLLRSSAATSPSIRRHPRAAGSADREGDEADLWTAFGPAGEHRYP